MMMTDSQVDDVVWWHTKVRSSTRRTKFNGPRNRRNDTEEVFAFSCHSVFFVVHLYCFNRWAVGIKEVIANDG
jgi:hypothetical protein